MKCLTFCLIIPISFTVCSMVICMNVIVLKQQHTSLLLPRFLGVFGFDKKERKKKKSQNNKLNNTVIKNKKIKRQKSATFKKKKKKRITNTILGKY